MNHIPTVITSSLLAVFYILVMHKCVTTFFSQKRKGGLVSFLLWLLYYGFQVSLEIANTFSPALILVLNMLFIFLITILLYCISLKRCIIFSALICAVWMFVEVILHMIFNLLKLNDESGLAGAVISKIIMLAFATFLGHCLKKKSSIDISGKCVIILLIIPIGSIYLMHNIFIICNRFADKSMFAFVSGILLLLINYIIFEVYERLAENAEYQKKTMLYEQQLELCSQQAAEREIQNAEIRQMRHDMKNHLTSILGMVQARDSEEATCYIHSLLEANTMSRIQEVSRSGNIVVDSLVNYKSLMAKKAGIAFNANVFIPVSLPFQSNNLTIILGNLLENALDACSQMQAGEPRIDLQISYQKGLLSIIVCNTYEGKRKSDARGHFHTTKMDREHHGLGLISVEQALVRYNGEIIVEMKNDIFKTAIIMYEEGEK